MLWAVLKVFKSIKEVTNARNIANGLEHCQDLD